YLPAAPDATSPVGRAYLPAAPTCDTRRASMPALPSDTRRASMPAPPSSSAADKPQRQRKQKHGVAPDALPFMPGKPARVPRDGDEGHGHEQEHALNLQDLLAGLPQGPAACEEHRDEQADDEPAGATRAERQGQGGLAVPGVGAAFEEAEDEQV